VQDSFAIRSVCNKLKWLCLFWAGISFCLHAAAQDLQEGDLIFGEEHDETQVYDYDESLKIEKEAPIQAEESLLPDEPKLEVVPAERPKENVPYETYEPAPQLAGELEESAVGSAKPYFGMYRIHIGLMRPEFSEDKNYEEIFGSYSNGPSFAVEYYPLNHIVPIGLMLKMSLYTDRGRPALNEDASNLDEKGKLSLSVMPLQMALVGQLPLLPAKWAVLGLWAGYERIFYQEGRDLSALIAAADAEDKVYVNRATKSATVLGASLSIRVTPEGGGPSAGFISAIPYRAIYLTSYFERVESRATSGLKLGGSRIGLGFNFEFM